jgi:hypothetical protein
VELRAIFFDLPSEDCGMIQSVNLVEEVGFMELLEIMGKG